MHEFSNMQKKKKITDRPEFDLAVVQHLEVIE